ncbi:MAG: C45 family peptidase [Thermoplasmatota archaeon]
MNGKIRVCFVSVVLTLTLYPMVSTEPMVYDPLDGGWLEDIDGVSILHVSGSFYEMGYQQGYLLRDDILENMRAFLDMYAYFDWDYDDVCEVWTVQEHYLPDEYKQEIQGMADGAGLSYEEVAVHNTWMGVFNHLHSCWGASLWGHATADGELLHLRSVDGVNTIHDPVTGTGLYENQVIIVRDPDDALASLAPIFAGDILSIGGFNEQGVAVSELTVIGTDTTFHGINAGYRMRMVLDRADDCYEAVEIMNANRTCCWNFIISDGKIPMGFALEQSANLAYVNTWFDPVESTDPFWAIEDVVRRGNFFITPALAAFQRETYDPSGLQGYLRMMLGVDSTFAPWTQYKAISDEIEKRYGVLDISTAVALLQNVYRGKTDLIFRLILTKQTHTGRQWVACPVTGDIHIRFSEHGEEAYLIPAKCFNLYDLLKRGPP